MTLSYEGTDQGGVKRTGLLPGGDQPADPLVAIRGFWAHGWRTLIVRDERQRVVAIIGKRKGRRAWMAWQTEPPGEVT